MYEDEGVYLEDISEEEYELVCNTFANELCGWVAYEVYKKTQSRYDADWHLSWCVLLPEAEVR